MVENLRPGGTILCDGADIYGKILMVKYLRLAKFQKIFPLK